MSWRAGTRSRASGPASKPTSRRPRRTEAISRSRSKPRTFRIKNGFMSNRLKTATSPYLLQHADNPVDWWPWGDEAFAEARRRDVPVLLSVGYAACHWCHVMAHESFEDPATAAVVNDNV